MFESIRRLFGKRPARNTLGGPAYAGGETAAVGHGGSIPEVVARGIGGRILLFADRIEIHRSGFLLSMIDMILHVEREIETTIFLEDLAAAHVVRSLLLIEYVRFSYPGSPLPTGHYLRDAFAENALMLRWTDNRAVGRLITRMNELRAERHPTAADASMRLSRRPGGLQEPAPTLPRKRRNRA